MVSKNVQTTEKDYVIQVHISPLELSNAEWNALLAAQTEPTPFMRHEYLAAAHTSGSAIAEGGWAPQWLTLRRGGVLQAACPLYAKLHSMGEYVFDFAWARAYAEHGLTYYPKGVVAPPFTPVPGTKLLAADANARAALLAALERHATAQGHSSLHALFLSAEDAQAASAHGWMLRHTVQFHWHNRHPSTGEPFASIGAFEQSLAQDKRKKMRAEQRKVRDAGVQWRVAVGSAISQADWAFFYRCYERTYLEHGNPPYLTPAFFESMRTDMPQHWVLFVAERAGQPMACSLIGLWDEATAFENTFETATNSIAALASSTAQNSENTYKNQRKVGYGRYWGALERVDSLHFDACYHQPIAWCIENGVQRFEGGAQGEHKMARGLMPVQATSAHWVAHPQFAAAIARYVERESDGVGEYLTDLGAHSPFKT